MSSRPSPAHPPTPERPAATDAVTDAVTDAAVGAPPPLGPAARGSRARTKRSAAARSTSRSTPYVPPKMARWKPPVLVLIAIGTVAAELAAGLAMEDRQNTTGYTVVVFAIVFVAFVVVVHVTSIGVVNQPTKRTALVVIGAIMVSMAVVGGIAGQTAFARLVVYPVCERLETDTTRHEGVSRTSSTTQPGARFFNRYLQCNYRTDDDAVPEGIPTSVDLRDGRLAGGDAGWMRRGYGLSTLAGFLLWFVVSVPFWKWWFRTLITASKRDPMVLAAMQAGARGSSGT